VSLFIVSQSNTTVKLTAFKNLMKPITTGKFIPNYMKLMVDFMHNYTPHAYGHTKQDEPVVTCHIKPDDEGRKSLQSVGL
jgi:hypothetical protein